MKSLLIIAAAVLGMSSCTKDPAATTAKIIIPADTCIKIDQVKPGWVICFDSVTNESRCPANANCIWQGYASIKLTLQSPAHSNQFILNTLTNNSAFRNDTTISGVNIRLVTLSPYPGLEGTGDSSRYVAELAITR